MSKDETNQNQPKPRILPDNTLVKKKEGQQANFGRIAAANEKQASVRNRESKKKSSTD